MFKVGDKVEYDPCNGKIYRWKIINIHPENENHYEQFEIELDENQDLSDMNATTIRTTEEHIRKINIFKIFFFKFPQISMIAWVICFWIFIFAVSYNAMSKKIAQEWTPIVIQDEVDILTKKKSENEIKKAYWLKRQRYLRIETKHAVDEVVKIDKENKEIDDKIFLHINP